MLTCQQNQGCNRLFQELRAGRFPRSGWRECHRYCKTHEPLHKLPQCRVSGLRQCSAGQGSAHNEASLPTHCCSNDRWHWIRNYGNCDIRPRRQEGKNRHRAPLFKTYVGYLRSLEHPYDATCSACIVRTRCALPQPRVLDRHSISDSNAAARESNQSACIPRC